MALLVTLKPIVDHEGYFVSDTGRVFSNLGKGNRHKGNSKELCELKQRPTKDGYVRIRARNDITGKRDDLYIHRLVAQHYLPNPENKEFVNHKNCNRFDNRLENLEWATVEENNSYAVYMGTVARNGKGRFATTHNYLDEAA